ncbi:unnamed protein product, partial [Musa textilis]
GKTIFCPKTLVPLFCLLLRCGYRRRHLADGGTTWKHRPCPRAYGRHCCSKAPLMGRRAHPLAFPLAGQCS